MSAPIIAAAVPSREAETPDDLALIDPLFAISVEHYEAMIDAGVIEDEYVELWEGRIYEKMAKNRPHIVSGNKATYALVRVLPDGWFVGIENTIVLGSHSAPLPDLVVLRGEPDDYRHRRPGPDDVRLILELAESSLRSDKGPKLRGYAKAGVVEYWVVNLVANVVHVYREPVPGESRFGWEKTYARGEMIELSLADRPPIPVAVDDLVPAP